MPDHLLDGLSAQERRRSWVDLLGKTDGSSFTLVAIGGENRVQGFCAMATPSRDEDAGERTAEVAATYVDPGCWGAGVGSALLEGALEELRRGGYRLATLWVFANNERARSFYRKFRFEPDGHEAQHEPSGGQVKLRLRADLG